MHTPRFRGIKRFLKKIVQLVCIPYVEIKMTDQTDAELRLKHQDPPPPL